MLVQFLSVCLLLVVAMLVQFLSVCLLHVLAMLLVFVIDRETGDRADQLPIKCDRPME